MPELFDPLDAEWLANKHQYYNELRRKQPVYGSKKYGAYVLTHYEDVRAALSNSAVYSSAKGNLVIESPHRFGQTLGASDNPTHDKLKSIVKGAYSKNNVERVLAGIQLKMSADMAQAAEEASIAFTTRLLNIPVENKVIEGLVRGIQQRSSKSVQYDCDDTAYDLFVRVVSTAGPPHGAGIYEAYFNSGKKYLSLMTGPTLSGTTSTTGALQFMLLDLANNPEQFAFLRENPDYIQNAVAESIRFNTSTGRFSRTLTSDVKLHGVTMQAGRRVVLCLDSANRDESVFTTPDTFDIKRTDLSASLGFGYGLHACIALFLSTAFLTQCLRTLLTQTHQLTPIAKPPKHRIMCAGNFDLIQQWEGQYSEVA